MLKWYADIFQFTEKTLSAKELKRQKVMSLLALPAVPLFSYLQLVELGPTAELMMYPILILSGIFLIITMFGKVGNSFWARDKYLDEWELERKHHAMAIGHQVSVYSFVVVSALIIIFTDWEGTSIPLTSDFIRLVTLNVVVFMFYVPLLFLVWTINSVDVV